MILKIKDYVLIQEETCAPIINFSVICKWQGRRELCLNAAIVIKLIQTIMARTVPFQSKTFEF